MEPEVVKSKSKSYVATWEQFLDKGLEVLGTEPIRSRYSIKYNHAKKILIVKVTDGKRIVMKRCKTQQDLERVEKFTLLATQLITKETPKQTVVEEKATKVKDKKKKGKK